MFGLTIMEDALDTACSENKGIILLGEILENRKRQRKTAWLDNSFFYLHERFNWQSAKDNIYITNFLETVLC